MGEMKQKGGDSMEQKETYVAPELTVYGSLASNTEGVGGPVKDTDQIYPAWGYHWSPVV
jgi:hypothetical protein